MLHELHIQYSTRFGLVSELEGEVGVPVGSQIQISSRVFIVIVPPLETYLAPILSAGPLKAFGAFVRICGACVCKGVSSAGFFIIGIPACRCHRHTVDRGLYLVIVEHKRRGRNLVLQLERLFHLDLDLIQYYES